MQLTDKSLNVEDRRIGPTSSMKENREDALVSNEATKESKEPELDIEGLRKEFDKLVDTALPASMKEISDILKQFNQHQIQILTKGNKLKEPR